MTTAPLRIGSAIFLHIEDSLLSKKDEYLPFGGHVVCFFQHFHSVEDLIFVVFMGAKKVVISNPESQVVVGAFDVVKTVRVTIRSLVSAVQPLDHLLERPVFCGDSIVVGKSDDLGDPEGKVLTELSYEFHSGKWVGTVTVSDELEVFRKLCKPPKSHAHGKDAWANTAVIRHLISNNGASGGIHDEPDIGFDASDFDVGLVSSENIPLFVRILINKGLDADSGSFAVVGDLLV